MVGVGVGVWKNKVVVDVGLATGSWEEDEGVGLVRGSSGMMSIGVAVSGPDGISGDVGVDCPSEEEPFVEELVESVEFRCIPSDFGRWE